MTLVIALQLLFPLLGIGYLVGAWRRDRVDPNCPVDDLSATFRPELLVRWDDERSYERCERSPRQVTRRAPRSRMVIERVPSRLR